jgi:hypothetical protein
MLRLRRKESLYDAYSGGIKAAIDYFGVFVRRDINQILSHVHTHKLNR